MLDDSARQGHRGSSSYDGRKRDGSRTHLPHQLARMQQRRREGKIGANGNDGSDLGENELDLGERVEKGKGGGDGMF